MTYDAFAICFEGKSVRCFGICLKPEPEAVRLKLENAVGLELHDAISTAISAVQDNGYRKQPLMIGLDCFQSMFLPLPESTGLHDSTNLAISLEENSPFDAENMIAIPYDSSFALAAIRNRCEPYIHQFEQAGMLVKWVVPTSILLALTLLEQQDLPKLCQLIIGSNHKEVVTVRNGSIDGWNFSTYRANLVVEDQGEVPRVYVKDAQTESTGKPGLGFASLLARGTRLAIHDSFSKELPSFPWLCLTAFISPTAGALQRLGVTTAFLLFCLVGASFWNTYWNTQILEQIDSEVQSIYQQVFPDRPASRMVEATLANESKKVAETAAVIKGTTTTDRIVRCLSAVVESMPNDFSVQLETIQTNVNKLVITGNAISLEDLDRLKLRLEELGFVSNPSEQEYGAKFRLSYLLPDSFDGIETAS